MVRAMLEEDIGIKLDSKPLKAEVLEGLDEVGIAVCEAHTGRFEDLSSSAAEGHQFCCRMCRL